MNSFYSKIFCITALAVLIIYPAIYAQNILIRNKNLNIEINTNLFSCINTNFPAARKMMKSFSSSEYLVTKYFTVKDFSIIKKAKRSITDSSGKGFEWTISAKNNIYHIEKILQIRVYENFPDAAFYVVKYVNHGKRELPVIKWVNHQLNILPNTDSIKFWSFMGSSNQDRRDWIQKIAPGFYQKNYMGMNATDYGGGIPVIDLWRKDAGIAMGHTEVTPKLVSLPVDYDKYGGAANICIEYEYPQKKILKPKDTLSTFQTFVSVHQKDCFATLRTFAQYMETKGIRSAASAAEAFEPMWCAWGYERDFTIKEILTTLPKVKELGLKWVGLDDGYQQTEGDWHTNNTTFPNGDADMKKFIDSIHTLELKAMLWWAPLAANPESKLLKADPNIPLLRNDGSPQYITWWNAYLMSPTYKGTIKTTEETLNLFLKEWGFDGLKLDGQHLNACAPDYSTAHELNYPEQACEQLPAFFKTLYNTARNIKPNAVVELCPCGTCISFYNMPYTNQFVASDPLSSWQVRLKGKVYKALMPSTAYFGDHVELTDDKEDFASQIGIGAVPGTKFVWPATGIASKDENLLTPEKELLFKKWFALYNDKMLSKATYRGDLYDIGYDFPETHCIQKNDTFYYTFFNRHFSGSITLQGLINGKKYKVTDYFNEKDLGILYENNKTINVSFDKFLLIEVKPIE